MASVTSDLRVRTVLIAGVILSSVLHGAGTVITTLPTPGIATRRPPVALGSLPTPQAGGPLKVLLIDDDTSENNLGGDPGVTLKSDEIYRELVAAVVGGAANAWSVDVVKARQPGPAFERMRAFNLIVWYTGGSYGGNYDTLGRDDEAALRRYLEEIGGSVVIISPGYVNNLVYGQSWDAADHPFLKEVLAVNGCIGLAERGVAGTVTAHDGRTYSVAHPGAAPTLFSFVNSDGAALVFTHGTRSRTTPTADPRPVAVANAHGRGRIVYAGFTLENVPDKERADAFGVLVSAAIGRPLNPAPVASVPPPDITDVMTYHPGWRSVRWTYPAPRDGIDHFDVIRRENGQWRVLAQGFTAGNAIGSYVYDDRSFCATDTAYRVAVVYKDGRRAETERHSFSVQPDPAPAINVTQTGPDEVTVAWGAAYVPGPGPDQSSLRYLVQGPGLPVAGLWIDTPAVYETVKDRNNRDVRVIVAGSNHRSVVLKNVSLGRHEIRVTPDYGVGTQRLLSPNPAIVTVEVRRWSGPVATSTQTLSVTPTITARTPVVPVPAPTATPLPAPGTGAKLPLKQAPPGPVPQLFKVTPINPAGGAGYTFSWTNVGDPQFRTLYRIDGDQLIYVAGHKTDTTPVANPAGPFSDSVWTDEPWIYPGTVFRLVVRYQDGRRAETEMTYANPPLPPTPLVLNLQAVQTGYRRVRISWTRRSASTGTTNSAIRVTGSGLNYQDCIAPRGAMEQWVDFDNVREGSHVVTIGMQQIWGKALPGAARLTFEVRPVSDHFRVSLLGFRVGRKTVDDDIFDGDGRGDEVFFTAFRALVSLRNAEIGQPARSLGIVQSGVIGDVNGFPDRQRLGSAGPTGGIRSGDMVPSEAALAPQPGLAVSPNRLPLLLWDGRLERDAQAAVIALNGWEWDVAPATPPNAWADRCNQVSAQDEMAEIARSQARQAPDVIRYLPLSRPDVREAYGASFSKGGTRPLGGLKAGTDAWDCVPQGIVLTLRNAEALLGLKNAAVVDAPLAMKRYAQPVLNKIADEDPSQYTAVLQVERLPMTDEELRTYSGMWVVAGMGGK